MADRVLVVDDEKDFREFMVWHLQRKGFEVESASDGVEGLEVLKTKGPFAVLVTDLNMPHMDGHELLRNAQNLDPHIEAIVISANDTITAAITALREDGAYDYLLKPLANNNELSLAVTRVADYRRLRMEREAMQAQIVADAQRLKTLIANTGDVILALKADGTISVANPAANRLFGEENLVGTNVMNSAPKTLTTLIANWQAVNKGRAAMVEASLGNNSVYMVSLTPIPNNDKNGGDWVMVLRDITHLKLSDEFKIRLLAEAANKIQIPLAQALDLVIELNQMAGGFKSEPLTRITFALARSLEQIRKWMEELLLIARIEAGIGVRPTLLDVEAIVKDWVEDAKKKIVPTTGININVISAGNLPSVYADRDLLLRLLKQLADHIIEIVKGQSGRSICYRLRHEEAQIWIDVTAEGSPLRKTDPLRRVTRPLNEPHKGVDPALPDLALITAIAQNLGGQVWIRDQERTGNAIIVCLPVARL